MSLRRAWTAAVPPRRLPRVARLVVAATLAAACAGPVCAPPAVSAGGGCVVPCGALAGDACGAPRLVAPLSTAQVSSRRPTLRWRPAVLDAVPRVDLCRDRACTSVEVSVAMATGGRAQPPAELAPGVHFWRVVERRTETGVERSSPVWEFFVGARSAPTDTSAGAVLDLNGDGRADVAVGDPSAERDRGAAHVYYGTGTSLPADPTRSLLGPDGAPGRFGGSVCGAGDVNGDGYGDLLVAAPDVPGVGGRIHVYLGSATGVADTPTVTLDGPGNGAQFGLDVAGLGDFNGDGYADVAVGVKAQAFVYLGRAEGLRNSPDLRLTGFAMDESGIRTAVGAADVNGDGFADLLVGSDQYPRGAGQVFVFHGRRTPLGGMPTTVLTGPDGPSGAFGIALGPAGDVNGDGFGDVLVSAFAPGTRQGHAHLFYGGVRGLAPEARLRLAGTSAAPDGFAESVGGVGDVNGDGFADVAATASTADRRAVVHVYLGRDAVMSPVPAVSLQLPAQGATQLPMPLRGAGDLTGDGYGDLLVGAPADGSAFLFPGEPAGVAARPSATLQRPGTFGWSIAWRASRARGGAAGQRGL